MRSIAYLGRKMSLAALVAVLSMSAAMANTLSEVTINAEESGYGIVLKTDETAQIKKTLTSDNKMILELKDVEVSSDFNTVYNNVTDIENVTVSPAAKSGVKIVFKGEGVSNSKISFENGQTVASSLNNNAQQTISLNAPISSYTPVYNPDAFAEDDIEDQTSNPQLNEVLTKMHVTKAMLVTAKTYAKKAINKVQSLDFNFATVIGVLFIAAALLLRPKKKSVPVEKQQSLTGMLSRNQRSAEIEREIDLSNRMANNMNLNRPVGLNSNPISAGYGMKAYQQSQRNPYTTNNTTGGVSGISRRKPLPTTSVTPVKKQTMNNKPVSVSSTAIKPKKLSMTNPVVAKTMPKAKAATVPSADLDSMKFLESITKIYENSGRADLAKGLKDNLKKAQLTSHAVL